MDKVRKWLNAWTQALIVLRRGGETMRIAFAASFCDQEQHTLCRIKKQFGQPSQHLSAQVCLKNDALSELAWLEKCGGIYSSSSNIPSG